MSVSNDSVMTSNDNMHESTSQDEDAEELVFQCVECKSILGDTSSWAGSSGTLRTISLKYVTKTVVVTDRLVTSKSDKDLGSTYNSLLCGVCKSDIGRLYRTTPSELDDIRGMYTLYVERISSYAIGSCAQDSEATSMTDLLALTSIGSLKAELKKLQTVIVSLDHRVTTLEKSSSGACDTRANQSREVHNKRFEKEVPSRFTNTEGVPDQTNLSHRSMHEEKVYNYNTTYKRKRLT